MEAKTIEIRDRMTFIPALAVSLKPGNLDDLYLLVRGGYDVAPGSKVNYVVLWRLEGGGPMYWSPDDWGDQPRTMKAAHEHIWLHWNEVESGDVVDVEFILGETDEPKVSESLRQ
jgi:hypothetical protein